MLLSQQCEPVSELQTAGEHANRVCLMTKPSVHSEHQSTAISSQSPTQMYSNRHYYYARRAIIMHSVVSPTARVVLFECLDPQTFVFGKLIS